MSPETKREQTTSTEWATEVARQLAEALIKARRTTKRPHIPTWTKTLSKLESVDTPEKIQKVAEWFIANIKEKYTPLVFSAESFRDKFIQLEAAYTRARGATAGPASPEVREALSRQGFRWSPDDTPLVVPFAQESLDAYQEFSARLAAFVPNPKKATHRAAVHMRAFHPSPRAFLAEWIRTVHRVSISWDGWTPGRLSFWAWYPTCRLWSSEMQPALNQQYGTGVVQWADVVEAVTQCR